MVWFKVDDGFHDHPKVIAAGNAAIGLWVRCGSYASDQLTDGFVSDAIATRNGTKPQIAKLVETGLWVPEDGGYRMHDFHDHNPTSEQVKQDRKANAQRIAKWRAEKRRNGVTPPVTPDACNGVSNAVPTRPVPSPLTSRSLTTPTVVGRLVAVEDDQGEPPEERRRSGTGVYADVRRQRA